MFFRDLNTSDFVQCFEKEKMWLQCRKLFAKVSTDRPWAVVVASGRGLGSRSYSGLSGAQFFPHMRGGSPGQPLGPWDVTQ